jgi:hypothetical protein
MHITFLLAGRSADSPVAAIRGKMAAGHFYFEQKPGEHDRFRLVYGPGPPAPEEMRPEGLQPIEPAVVETAGTGPLPTDDWPFLYLRDRGIPALNVRGMVLVAALSLLILFLFAPVHSIRPDGQMFFLGAGFMLLETKGVVQMALLFGATWSVNSIVFAAILVMILASNLYVLAVRPRTLRPYYALLFASLVCAACVPLNVFLALPQAAKTVLSASMTFAPIAFAGIIFAASFRDRRRPGIALGSNIGGVILGGLCEFFSLILGFNSLLFFAMGFYALSAIFARGRTT